MSILKLTKPITIGKKTLESLTFRDYTIAEDYLAFDNRGGVAQRIALIAAISGTDEAVIKQLHGADYLRAEKLVSVLLDHDADDADGVESEDAAEKKWSE
jgi:hypothetical protein